jgi:hypothetical protein
MDFRIGLLISAYDEEGLPCFGIISGFDGVDPKMGPMAIMCLSQSADDGSKRYIRVRLDTAHPHQKKYIKHTRQTFLAAVSASSPVLYFKDDKSRRDFAEHLWRQLNDFSMDNEPA